MGVMQTLTEADLREIGVTSFGVRRKLSMALKSYQNVQVLSSSEESTFSDLTSSSSAASSPCAPTAPEQPSTPSTPLTPSTPSTSCPSSSGRSKLTFTKPDDFQLKEILEGNQLGEGVLEELEAGHLTIASRKKLVQVLVAYLTEQVGSLYPTGPQKVALARAIVEQYPCTKDSMPGTEGYVEFLKYHPPVPENKGVLKTYFKDTHKFRQKTFKSNLPSVTQILSDWPRLRDMPELINVEFDLMFTTGSEFLSKWHHQFTTNILHVAKRQNKAALNDIISRYVDGDDDLCSLELLVTMLRTSNYRKNVKGKGASTSSASTIDAVSFLIQNTVVGTDVNQWCQTKLPKYTQPFLLGLGPATKPTQYFIISDSTNIPVGQSILVAFDRLFKFHYVLNLHFALPLINFFNFFEGLIYKVVEQDKISPQVRSFNVSLTSVGNESN